MNPINNTSTDYKETRWHLLKVGANGEVRPFIHFKGWILFGCVLIGIMFIATGWFLCAWLALQEELDGAQQVNIQQKQDLQALKSEKDAVLARLAIAQSKLKMATAALADRTEPKPDVKDSNASSQPTRNAKSAQNKAEAKPNQKIATAVASPAKKESTSSEEVVIYEKVIADNVFACAQPDDSSLTVEFKVINMGTRHQPVSGHAFIILKGADHSQDEWVVLPRALLVNGRPAESRGQRFRIYNFRTIKFKFGHENPGVFTHATIFIFRHTGELMFERDFTLEPIKLCK